MRGGSEPGSAPGTYALLLRCPKTVTLRIGALGERELGSGWYVYVGSALGPGGVRARVRRHLRGPGNRHWHLDYLSPAVQVVEVWYVHHERRWEHLWARGLEETEVCTGVVSGFGASDCDCGSHLLRFRERPDVVSLTTIPETESGWTSPRGIDPAIWWPVRSGFAGTSPDS
ncbi:MAG: GIY-YIG nuclease family protein [Thermoanaerobaculia bacterium]|nr:GIY-YIG nuclease family protein [Thermoanaerobaculia bacterium]